MNYTFPHITNISQVLPVIKDRQEFIVAEKEGGYTVVNYAVAFADTFPPVVDEATAILRELRGIIFDTATGNVLHRRFHKFFNVNERPETQVQLVDLSKPHVILEKLDGSMITPVMTTDGLRWGTKMGCTDVAKPVEAFVAKHPIYATFAYWTMSEGLTGIFEWCSRQQKIVIDYPEDMLVLTAIRYNNTGEYMSYAQMVEEVADLDIPVVKAFAGTAANMQHLIDQTSPLLGAEGYVVRFDDGHMLKVKAEDYMMKHKTKDAISLEKNVVEIIVSEKADDMKAFMDANDLERFCKFEQEFWDGVKTTVDVLEVFFNNAKPHYADKRSFAVEFVQKQKSNIHRFMYAMWDGKDALSLVIDAIKSSTGTQTKIDECRWLFNCNWNANVLDE